MFEDSSNSVKLLFRFLTAGRVLPPTNIYYQLYSRQLSGVDQTAERKFLFQSHDMLSEPQVRGNT